MTSGCISNNSADGVHLGHSNGVGRTTCANLGSVDSQVALGGLEQIDPIELFVTDILQLQLQLTEFSLVVGDIIGVLGHVQGHGLELGHTIEDL